MASWLVVKLPGGEMTGNPALRKRELSSPVSSVHAWNAWDHDPTFGDQKRLAFSDSGSPAETE